MKRRLPFAALLLVTLAGLSAASCQRQQPTRLSRVVVTGQSDLKAQPDTAVVVLSVVTQGARAVDVQRENARQTEAVITAVRGAAGGSPPEVKTSDYSLQPQRDWGSGGVPKIRGYEARNSVRVTTTALDSVGALIDAASQAGANSVDGVSFVLREGSPARRETLAEATREAWGKAEAIAAALGGRVVRVVEQQEGGAALRPPHATWEEYESRAAYDTAASMNANMATLYKRSPQTPVESGPLNVRSQVQLVVEIEAKP